MSIIYLTHALSMCICYDLYKQSKAGLGFMKLLANFIFEEGYLISKLSRHLS